MVPFESLSVGTCVLRRHFQFGDNSRINEFIQISELNNQLSILTNIEVLSENKVVKSCCLNVLLK